MKKFILILFLSNLIGQNTYSPSYGPAEKWNPTESTSKAIAESNNSSFNGELQNNESYRNEEFVVTVETGEESCLDISWTNIENATGYTINIDGELMFEFEEITTSDLSYTICGLMAGTEYEVTVTAYNNSEESEQGSGYGSTLDFACNADGSCGVEIIDYEIIDNYTINVTYTEPENYGGNSNWTYQLCSYQGQCSEPTVELTSCLLIGNPFVFEGFIVATSQYGSFETYFITEENYPAFPIWSLYITPMMVNVGAEEADSIWHDYVDCNGDTSTYIHMFNSFYNKIGFSYESVEDFYNAGYTGTTPIIATNGYDEYWDKPDTLFRENFINFYIENNWEDQTNLGNKWGHDIRALNDEYYATNNQIVFNGKVVSDQSGEAVLGIYPEGFLPISSEWNFYNYVPVYALVNGGGHNGNYFKIEDQTAIPLTLQANVVVSVDFIVGNLLPEAPDGLNSWTSESADANGADWKPGSDIHWNTDNSCDEIEMQGINLLNEDGSEYEMTNYQLTQCNEYEQRFPATSYIVSSSSMHGESGMETGQHYAGTDDSMSDSESDLEFEKEYTYTVIAENRAGVGASSTTSITTVENIPPQITNISSNSTANEVGLHDYETPYDINNEPIQFRINLESTVFDHEGYQSFDYEWTQLSGPEIEIINADQSEAYFITGEGTGIDTLNYLFQLNIVDSYAICNGAPCTGSDTALRSITVFPEGDSGYIAGCTDEDFLNYNPEANINDGSCSNTEIEGCLDESACNFDNLANTQCVDCCEYPTELFDCDGNCLVEIDCNGICGGAGGIEDIVNDCCPEIYLDECGKCFGNNWDYCDDNGNGITNIEEWGYGVSNIEIRDVPEDQGGRVYINFESSILDSEVSHFGLIINMYDSYGDGWNGNILSIGDSQFTLNNGTESIDQYIGPYNVSVYCGGGSWPSEVLWFITDANGNELLSGGAPYYGCLGDCSYLDESYLEEYCELSGGFYCGLDNGGSILGENCIPSYYVCDNYDDCLDGADEEDCEGLISLNEVDQNQQLKLRDVNYKKLQSKNDGIKTNLLKSKNIDYELVQLNSPNPEIETEEDLRTNMYTIERLDGETWVGLQSIIAYEQDEYTVEVTTLSDSTASNPGLTEFRVIASMNDEVYISNETAIGYSVDNLPPAIPTNLFAVFSEEITQLTWDESQDPNLQYYVIYRNEELYGYADENNFIDEEPTNPDMTFYQVSAIDYSGNISPMSTPVLPSDFILGDVTIDGQVNILDIIIIVDHIMGTEELSFIQLQTADYIEDEIINVNDIVAIIYLILDN